MKTILHIVCYLLLGSTLHAQTGYDTIKVYFPINVHSIDKSGKKTLDSFAGKAANKTMLIYGYADYLGKEPSNYTLANNRADQVKDYLLKKKINAKNILICKGIGEVSRNLPQNGIGFPEDRRVEIFVKKDIALNFKSVEADSAQAKEKPGRMIVSEISASGELLPYEHKTIQIPADTPESLRQQIAAQKIPSRFDRLSKLKPGDVLEIENLHFIPTRHFLTEASKPILTELLITLRKNPKLRIRIEGHVCCVKGSGDALDTDTYELKLSENRAKHIYSFLVASGIEASRLEYVGHGKRYPIIPQEKTEDDAQKNRRVEIRILGN